jgi:ribosomal protein S27E
MNSLNKLLKKFCSEGKTRFYFSEFVEEGQVSVEEAEKFLIPLMGNGKIEGTLELRCPNCGKDLGIFKRVLEIPEENSCQICGYEFCRSTDYMEIVLEVNCDFFRSEQCRSNTHPEIFY